MITKNGVLLVRTFALVLAALLAWLYPYTAAAQSAEHSGGVLVIGHSEGSPKPMRRSFTVEVSSKGFNGTPEMKLEAAEGDEVEINFVFVDDLSMPNAHRISIPEYSIDTGVINKENPKVAVRFVANKKGTFSIICLYPCAAHQNMLEARLVVKEAASVGGTVSGGPLSLAVPERAVAGEPMRLTAVLKDASGSPLPNAGVSFAQKTDFFVEGEGSLSLGVSTTDDRGVAVLEYTPLREGIVDVVAKHEGSRGTGPAQANLRLSVEPGSAPWGYTPGAGIRPLIKMRVGGDQSPFGLSFPVSAPWGLAFVVTGIWGAYYIVMYQVFQIGAVSTGGGGVTRWLVPSLGLGLVVMTASALIFMVLTGPYTHHHLGPPPVPWPMMNDVH